MPHNRIENRMQDSEKFKSFFQQPTEYNLLKEISDLREEIVKLRQDLAPVPTLILTGQEVLQEFKNLKREKPNE